MFNTLTALFLIVTFQNIYLIYLNKYPLQPKEMSAVHENNPKPTNIQFPFNVRQRKAAHSNM